ncbi:hypothetical protein EJ08DRAFT_54333 [Tothia fuscella]|uniref:Uncharacterized protein n=1 Tax=Tothia fuscella TaxID=1048955 RepID=A0A9P4NEZ8_9PEZI|nr:hypothetical protein EJ08DRAFT_54333 [Tothia fuscella]
MNAVNKIINERTPCSDIHTFPSVLLWVLLNIHFMLGSCMSISRVKYTPFAAHELLDMSIW